MKTLIIQTRSSDDPTYAIVEGDYSHLNNTAVGFDSGEKVDSLMELIYNTETWEEKVQFYSDISLLINKEWDTAFTFYTE